MELFSKRYNPHDNQFLKLSLSDDESDDFLNAPLRNRLQQEIQFLVSQNEYLEPYLLVRDENEDKYFIRAESIQEICKRVLGYDLTASISMQNLDFIKGYVDSQFLDLIELLIIFSKKEKRDEFRARLQNIIDEEGGYYVIHDYIIIVKNDTGLSSVATLIQNPLLKKKINDYYQTIRSIRPTPYESLARITADIVQLLLSGDKKKQTKTFTETLLKKIATKWTTKQEVQALSELLNITVTSTKKWNNTISNIRHTDRSTIPVSQPNIYKLIVSLNINIAELIILSAPEKYITRSNSEGIKKDYLGRYKLESHSGWVIPKRVNIEDIPF